LFFLEYTMRACLIFALGCLVSGAAAASAGPVALSPPKALSAPVDRPYIGTLTLDVDASDTRHGVYAVRETIPVEQRSDVILLYPQWETASHAPTASVSRLAGLIIHGGGRELQWARDPYNPYAFQVHVPDNVHALDMEFQYLSPASSREGALSMTPSLINVQWQSMLLYPAGYYARAIPITATLKLPDGFTAFTALDATAAANPFRYATVSLETLVDSPVYAGRYTRRIALTSDRHPVSLDLLGDAPASLAVDDATIARFRQSVLGTERLFGTPPWRRYDILVSLSDTFPGPGGTEHLESGENNLAADFFINGKDHLLDRDLIWHELLHAWNGKHRVPEGLWTPNFNTAADDSLLWVYEGQTQFWGEVLAARFGERSRQDTLDMWAYEAASMLARAGRTWKSLADSSLDPVYDAGHHITWLDWQRREDYYLEGPLFWLDVDATLREKSRGRHSLDDLATTFFQGNNAASISTYSFTDVCRALNRLAPADWTAFLQQKLNSHTNDGLLDGLTKNGYVLFFDQTPSAFFLQHERDDGASDFMFSIGLTVDEKGTVRSLAWNGPAFQAGLGLGAHIVGIGDTGFSIDGLRNAVTVSAREPLRLRVDTAGVQTTMRIPYRGTLRYPHLKRLSGTADGLLDVLRRQP
jgi:predicted metalloprotease with PDZ domain